MQFMLLDEYYLLFVKYMQYPGTVLGKGQSFLIKFANVEMFKMKNNTILLFGFYMMCRIMLI